MEVRARVNHEMPATDFPQGDPLSTAPRDLSTRGGRIPLPAGPSPPSHVDILQYFSPSMNRFKRGVRNVLFGYKHPDSYRPCSSCDHSPELIFFISVPVRFLCLVHGSWPQGIEVRDETVFKFWTFVINIEDLQ